jgi:peptidoglycan hydrolase-like protein with peptidoglycan-binding domain
MNGTYGTYRSYEPHESHKSHSQGFSEEKAMKKALLQRLSIAIALLIPVFAVAQTPDPATQPPEQASSSQTTGPPITDWRITEKEVKAVQAELTLRGYYKSKVTGVLDRDTRAAVRAYQINNGLKDSGRIDVETYRKLDLPYPATGKEVDRLRSDALSSKIGYEVKDTTAGAGDAANGGAKKVGSGVRGGLEKTWDAGAGAVSKSKEVARGAGDAMIKGVKKAGRAGARPFGRGDTDLEEQVRRLLEENPETRSWQFLVKKGTVTIKTPPNHNADVGSVVSNIRQIPGVESIFVIAL